MGELTETAKGLLNLRRGQLLRIKDADTFFEDLAEKVSALEEFEKPHPLSSKIAVATLKKYMADDKFKIRLHDLIMDETERLCQDLSEKQFNVCAPQYSDKELFDRVCRYESLVEILQSLMATGGYWGDENQSYIWARCIQRIANLFEDKNGINCWLNLRSYPVLLLQYAGGLTSVATGRYYNLKAFLVEPMVTNNGHACPVVLSVYPNSVFKDVDKRLPGMERRHTPISDHLYTVMREPMRGLLPSDNEYMECFDKFEYLLALIHADFYEKGMQQRGSDHIWGPVGRFGWRNSYSQEKMVKNIIENEAKILGDNWSLLKSGLFDGLYTRSVYIKNNYDKLIQEIQWD
jgi:hypothetical protein